MAGITNAFTRRAEALADGIKDLESGLPSFVFLGVTYVAGDIGKLDQLYEYYLARSAREAIMGGAQEHSLLGRTFKRADLAEINRTIEKLQPLADVVLGTTPTRTGPRMRYGVPV